MNRRINVFLKAGLPVRRRSALLAVLLLAVAERWNGSSWQPGLLCTETVPILMGREGAASGMVYGLYRHYYTSLLSWKEIGLCFTGWIQIMSKPNRLLLFFFPSLLKPRSSCACLCDVTFLLGWNVWIYCPISSSFFSSCQSKGTMEINTASRGRYNPEGPAAPW